MLDLIMHIAISTTVWLKKWLNNFCDVIVIIKAKIAKEFKEKIAPDMLGTLQKHVKDGHINGSEVC